MVEVVDAAAIARELVGLLAFLLEKPHKGERKKGEERSIILGDLFQASLSLLRSLLLLFCIAALLSSTAVHRAVAQDAVEKRVKSEVYHGELLIVISSLSCLDGLIAQERAHVSLAEYAVLQRLVETCTCTALIGNIILIGGSVLAARSFRISYMALISRDAVTI